MSDVLVRELIVQIPQILTRISEAHADCAEIRDKLNECHELTARIIKSEEEKASSLLQLLRNLEKHLNAEERKRFIKTIDYLMKDASGFINAMLD